MPATDVPALLDFATAEAYSEALRTGGHLAPGLEGVLTADDGLLHAAVYDADGFLRFIDQTRRLSPLYLQRRDLRPDAPRIVAAEKRSRDAAYQERALHA